MNIICTKFNLFAYSDKSPCRGADMSAIHLKIYYILYQEITKANCEAYFLFSF
jgi:hypothetical protein